MQTADDMHCCVLAAHSIPFARCHRHHHHHRVSANVRFWRGVRSPHPLPSTRARIHSYVILIKFANCVRRFYSSLLVVVYVVYLLWYVYYYSHTPYKTERIVDTYIRWVIAIESSSSFTTESAPTILIICVLCVFTCSLVCLKLRYYVFCGYYYCIPKNCSLLSCCCPFEPMPFDRRDVTDTLRMYYLIFSPCGDRQRTALLSKSISIALLLSTCWRFFWYYYCWTHHQLYSIISVRCITPPSAS